LSHESERKSAQRDEAGWGYDSGMDKSWPRVARIANNILTLYEDAAEAMVACHLYQEALESVSEALDIGRGSPFGFEHFLCSLGFSVDARSSFFHNKFGSDM
jgi:hypothetical protein